LWGDLAEAAGFQNAIVCLRAPRLPHHHGFDRHGFPIARQPLAATPREVVHGLTLAVTSHRRLLTNLRMKKSMESIHSIICMIMCIQPEKEVKILFIEYSYEFLRF
jgi:hypothetical protein